MNTECQNFHVKQIELSDFKTELGISDHFFSWHHILFSAAEVHHNAALLHHIIFCRKLASLLAVGRLRHQTG